jgi:hypothetical protein
MIQWFSGVVHLPKKHTCQQMGGVCASVQLGTKGGLVLLPFDKIYEYCHQGQQLKPVIPAT